MGSVTALVVGIGLVSVGGMGSVAAVVVGIGSVVGGQGSVAAAMGGWDQWWVGWDGDIGAHLLSVSFDSPSLFNAL